MTMFRVGPAGIPASLKTDMNSVLNKKFGTTGQNYPPNGWPDDVNLMGPLPEGTATGPIASISDGADRVPIKSWNVNIDPNLTGKSAVKCTQTKKNLIDNRSTAWENGTINASGNNASGTGTRTIDYFELKGGATITVSGIVAPSTTSDFRIFYYDENKVFLSYRNYSASYIVPDDVRYIRIRNVSVADISALQIEYGATATTYEPYTAPTVSTVNLDRTIYGGSADVVNGTGTSTHKSMTIAEMGFSRSSDYFQVSRDSVGAGELTNDNIICSCYSRGSSSGDKVFWFTSTYIRFRDSDYTTVEQMESAIGNDTFVFPEATPDDITFDPITPTPETPESHSANFWADTGDSTVVYRRDIDLALQAVSGTRNLLMMATRPEVLFDNDPEQLERTENPTEQEGDINNER